jgi:hypothetical protein
VIVDAFIEICQPFVNPLRWSFVVSIGGDMSNRLGLLGVFLLFSVCLLWASGVTGSWRITISAEDGKITGVGSLSNNGGAVTGWVGPSESDPIPVSGVLKGDKLTLETHPQPGRTVAFARCELTVKGDTMAGTIDTDKGTIEFVRSAPSNGPR